MFGYRQEFMPPDVMEGAYLEGQRSLFSIVVPEATENLVINPSPVLNTTGYSAMAGSIASSTTRQRRGPNSIRVAPAAATTDGAYYGTVTTVTGWNTFSLDFWGYPGVPYKIYFATTGAALLGSAVEFVGEGLWRRPEVRLYEAAGTTRRVYFTKNGSADTNYFYVDGLQVEAKDHSTTYTDGSMLGFVVGQTAYYWTGAKYASTSKRILDTSSGGKVVSLSDYSFKLLGYTGLGMSTVENISIPYARIDGENYQTSRLSGRDFSVLGELSGNNRKELEGRLSRLINDITPARIPTRQPILLLYRQVDELDNLIDDNIYKLVCSYIGGLEGNVTNNRLMRLGMNFRAASPDIEVDGVSGISIGFNQTFTTNYLTARIDGLWQSIGTGFNGVPRCTLYDSDRGRIYFGGDFTTANGVTVNSFCYYDLVTKTFVAVGGATKGVNLGVFDMAKAPNGDIWIVGGFTSAGGTATKYVAKYVVATDTFTCYNLASTGSFWSSVCVDLNGIVYVGGNLTNWNGAGIDYLAKYDGSAWAGVGVNPFVSEYPYLHGTMAVDQNNRLIVGTSAAATAHVYRYDGTSWTTLATADDTGIFNVLVLSNGNYVIAGNFTSLNSVTGTSGIALYNQSTVLPLGDGLDNTAIHVAVMRNGSLVIGSAGTGFGPPWFGNPVVIYWNGFIFTSAEIKLSSSSNVWSVSVAGDDIYATQINSRTANAAAQTTVTTTAIKAYPKVTITGPTTAGTSCTLKWLENQTTKETLYFDLDIQCGETVTIDFAAKTIESSWLGRIAQQPLAGSRFDSFHLGYGGNVISMHIDGTITGVTSVMTWRTIVSGLGGGGNV